MFRRYPYWGWLLLSLLLWCINGYKFHAHRQALLPEKMAAAVNADLRYREDAFTTFTADRQLIQDFFNGSLSERDAARINNLPFYLYAYTGDTLLAWNTNSTMPAGINDSARHRPVVLQSEKGVFIEKSIDVAYMGEHKTLLALFPVLINYPVENAYLKSHFIASADIPAKTKIIVNGPLLQGYPITMRDNTRVFSLQFNPEDAQKWTPDALFVLLLIAAVLASISWIQLMIIHYTRRRSVRAGVWATLAVILAIRLSLVFFGLPFNLDTLTFFSPALYASSAALPSFGHLFINTLCVLWFVVFITRHTKYRNYFDRVRNNGVRYAIAVVLIIALISFVFLFVNIVRSLVLDSNISFDVSHFYNIDVYTILGLLTIGIVTGICCLVIYLFNVQLNALLDRDWRIKYLLIVVVSIVLAFVAAHQADILYWVLLTWLLLFIILADHPKMELVSDLFEPRMIFWAFFICLFGAGVLYYFNNMKEREKRLNYVKLQLSPNRDELAEFAFYKVADSIAQSKAIKSFFDKPTLAGRKAINTLIGTQYLSGSALSKYDAKIYLYEPHGGGLFNSDSTDFFSLLDEKNDASATNTSNLYYVESILDRNYYLSYIKVYSDTINNVIGYVMIDLSHKKQANETVNSELLQPAFSNNKNSEYTYAIYINDKLLSQINDYSFPTQLRNDTLAKDQYNFYKNKGVVELMYKISDNRTIVVVRTHSAVIEFITLFSYLFGLLVVIAIVILLYQLYLSYFTSAFITGKFVKFTLRRRIHLSMLAVVLFSFIVIGLVTITFFTYQYKNSNRAKLQSAMQLTKQSLQDYLKREHAYDTDIQFDSVSRSGPFRSYVMSLANSQKTDINVFGDNGMLYTTSEEDIYNKGVLSTLMRPDAYYQMSNSGKSILIQDERVADLPYLSAYEPLRDDHGVTLGYINIPLFSSEKDLNFQISNIVVTLINLYAFIFLLASSFSIIVVRWITFMFNVITRQFEQLNLQQNERITWPYDDEIGKMVEEYNKMVNKVEENAAMLAQSERETAWREMARQVAHEIKNPLTPMKLNIQYLQQALRNDSPNVKELTDRVAASIIEQIDNLSYIASEFSNFAKMPEARPEEVELGGMLKRAMELYLNDDNIKFTITESPEKLLVFCDRSQLLRVFTNLLENAKQAILPGASGEIDVILKREDGTAVVSVTDNGQGIPEDVVKKIFQPYFTTKSSGTGLGLAMTRKIIEFWKGEIWFETKEGEGTTFFIRLPLIQNGV